MNARILIVEDDPSIRLGLKRSLEFEGFTVDLARDGEEAIQRAFDKKPDLIVLDIMLPRVNGFEVCRTVRKYDSTLPILILSAKGDEGDKVLGLEIDAVIPVPESSCTAAQAMAEALGVKYREGFVKNRYVGRTFIMPSDKQRAQSVLI